MKTLIAALLVATALPLDATIRVVDDGDNAITLEAPVQRIVSLAPHATELLFAAGALPRVVGVVRGSDHPEEARALRQIGDVSALDLERIVSLKPDLVVTWPYTMPAQVAALKRRGIAVFTTDPKTIDGIAADIERLGELAGTRDAASRSARAFRTRYASLAAHASEDRPRVFYQVWNSPLFTVGSGHLISQAIHACGGENVFNSIRVPAPQVSIEAVLAARPDIIVAGAERAVRPQWLDDWLRWPELSAVRNRKLHVVDANLLHRPGPRFIDGVEALCAAIRR